MNTLLDTMTLDGLQAAIAALQDAEKGLGRSLWDMEQKTVRARRRNWGAVALALLITALAWVWGGSAWLRWGIAPAVMTMVAAFECMHHWLYRRMCTRLQALQLQTAQFHAQLQTLRAAE